MPAFFLSSHKVLYPSANLMLRRPHNSSFSHRLFIAARQPATTCNSYQLDDIHPLIESSTLGRFNYACSIPLVISYFRSCLHTSTSFVQDFTKGSPTIKFLRNMVSALSSLSCKLECGVRELEVSRRMMMKSLPIFSDFHQVGLLKLNTNYELPSSSHRFSGKSHENAHFAAFNPVFMKSTLIGRNTSLQYRKRISGCLRNREPVDNNMFYKCFWSDMTRTISKTGQQSEPYMQNFSLSSAPCSTGAVPNVSVDDVAQEDQIESSGASSNSKFSGDRTLKLLSGSCYLPHPEKEETGGEDAHFISTEHAIGVADGVGGWAELGVDAGQYARELMSHSVSAISEEPKGCIDPTRVLEKAYISTKARGSSTACIVALTNEGVHAVNLGDSGFIIVRDGSAVFRSPVQQHDFNYTFQLESGNASDLPSSGQVFTVPVMAGDVIVAGTDGLFDNLYSNDVTSIVVRAIKDGLGPQATAQKIAALARKCAVDRNRRSPFSAAAQEAGYRYHGGKLDDITVVVSYVTSTST